MQGVHGEGLKKQTDNKFLNMYEADAVQRDGTHFPYYFATRRLPGDLMYENGILRPDGVVIYAVCQENPEKLVLIKQFRYPVNTYMYELPAGLVDAGEEPLTAAKREMREETGMEFEAYMDYPEYLKRAFVQNQGMSDECDVTVFGYAKGKTSQNFMECTEDIQVVLADKKEVKRILNEEVVSMRAMYLLTAFLKAEPMDPFSFLRV